ncbi:TIGR03767 family metallophosphoesterase [Nakamurella sp. YIM 132087]|uniref:TIGR03767 family metallophosphoesterase n=1 Tax=Nakamurella alba TaxID=2665158 RepID=A0A7K1FL59_9ACTN|nr:TIGR03767 family metallophosphoesterase [Nakamurella alba]MTD13614.1 TIGR03767 family metallophosphoesterase [Nakamurella alba]
MAGLSRRRFVAGVGALAALWSIDPAKLGAAAQASRAGVADDVGTTLDRTILQGAVQSGSYRTLVEGQGEPYLPRLDVLRKAPGADRAKARRSLLYLGHLSDLHVIDAQSPGRIEPMIVQDHAAWGSAFHPQDPLTVHATAAMVKSFSDARISPLTGAPMGAAIVTGDSADMHNMTELRWYIDLMDGTSVLPSTGSSGTWEGVQAWAEATWAYRPNDPTGGDFGDYGFPRLPDLLAQAMAQPVRSTGLPVPWYAVYGNHDTLMLGTFDVDAQWRAFATGGQKSYSLEGTAATLLTGYASTASPLQRFADALGVQAGTRPGLKSVSADPARRLFEQRDFMVEHFATLDRPGPVGHGFTQHNLDTGETWWKADLTSRIRAFGLDTCNQVAGPDGAVPKVQLTWLRGELAAAQAEGVLALIFSHHNSLTLENRAQRPGESDTLIGGEEFVAALLEYPVVIGWLNGHTHLNQILAHTRPDGGGFWEITTASCIDFPQQQQLVEIVDNRDGTLSLFTTVLDHASPVTPGNSGSYLDLASRSRELAANDWAENPVMRRGSPLDRNTELLLPAPFDLSVITDAALEAQHTAEMARLLDHENRLGG